VGGGEGGTRTPSERHLDSYVRVIDGVIE
jgi:hypothetical protein